MWVWVKYDKQMLIVSIHFVVFERITQPTGPQARSSNHPCEGCHCWIFHGDLPRVAKHDSQYLAPGNIYNSDPEVGLEDCQSLDESDLRTFKSWQGHGRVYVGWAPSRLSLCSQGSFPACRAARAACSGRTFVATPGDILVS